MHAILLLFVVTLILVTYEDRIFDRTIYIQSPFHISKQKNTQSERFSNPYRTIRRPNTTLCRLNHYLRKDDMVYQPSAHVFHTSNFSWQRKYGHCKLYDDAAALYGNIIDCEPIPFRYKKKNWLIEFWKGQYGAALGAEVGIYCTDQPDIVVPDFFTGLFYQAIAPSEFLPIEIVCRRNGVLLFVRSETHWWLNAYLIGEYARPSDLSLDISITFPCVSMRRAFVQGLRKCGYQRKEYDIRRNKVFVSFTTPHTKQPVSRVLLEESRLLKSYASCHFYQAATLKQPDCIQALLAIRHNTPDLYHKLIPLGKSKKLYESIYRKIKTYL